MKKLILLFLSLFLLTNCGVKTKYLKDIISINENNINEIKIEHDLSTIGPDRISKTNYYIIDNDDKNYYINLLNEEIKESSHLIPPGSSNTIIYFNDKKVTLINLSSVYLNNKLYSLNNKINLPSSKNKITYNFTNFKSNYEIFKGDKVIKNINNLGLFEFKEINEIIKENDIDFKIKIDKNDYIYLYEVNKFKYDDKTYEIVNNNIFNDLYK